MRYLKYIGNLVAAMVLSLTYSCNDDFLSTQPLDRVSSEVTWADGALSQAFVFNVYSFLHYGGFESQMLASYSDEATFTHTGRNINTFVEGNENPSNLAWFAIAYDWERMYLAIRQANIALEQLPLATFDDDELKERLTGEVHFLRAYYYHQLLRYYGGVPLVDRPYDLNEDYSVERSSYEAVTNFILADLEEATRLLEGKPETAGRASMLAAMGLKARVLLYAASDSHDANSLQAASSTLGGYANPELIAYTDGDREARWRAARDAAKAVLDAGAGYKLDLSEPVSQEEGIQNYIAVAMGGGSAVADAAAAVELIFQRTHTALYTVEDNWPLGGINFGINNGPNGYHNWAGNTPLQQLVDDYEMMDGSSFDWDNEDHAGDPYANRDPRFYASILYDAADWKPRPSDVAGLEPVNEIQTGFYDDGNGGVINGIDTRGSTIENWNGSRTHYYVRKFIDPDPSLADNQSSAQVIPWPFIRYSEMLLSYAEASIELRDEQEARDWLTQLRYRVGLPAVTDAGEDLVNRLRNERRIELAYEEHRYHDARRWLIAAETQGRPVKATDVRAKLKAGMSPREPYVHDRETYDYEYTVYINTEAENRRWEDKMYYRPLGRDEIFRNTLLVQNPGYE